MRHVQKQGWWEGVPGKIVNGNSAHHGGIQMRVGVNAPRHDILAFCIDYACGSISLHRPHMIGISQFGKATYTL